MHASYSVVQVPLNPVVSGRFSFESSSSILIKALDAPLELVIGLLEELTGVSLDEVGAEVSLDEGAGLLDELGTGSLDGLEMDSLSQLNHMNAVPRMNIFPRMRFNFLFML